MTSHSSLVRSNPAISGADITLLHKTMLAVSMEVVVSKNQDGSGTGCWILDSAGITRLRERHGNFSYAQRGGSTETPYYSARLVGAPGSSPFYLIHHISTVATGMNNEFLGNAALDVSHLCPTVTCWNPFHLLSEARQPNINRRKCVGDIVDRDGSIVHVCACPTKKCIGSQNVRLSSVVELENVRVINSTLRLKELIQGLAQHLNIPDIHRWSLKNANSTRPYASQYSLSYEHLTERLMRAAHGEWEHDILDPNL